MFMISECILFISIIFFNNDLFKYLGIMLCLFYGLYFRKKASWVLGIVLIADYCLLLSHYYHWGILLFMIVQWCYHKMLQGTKGFYLWLLFIIPWQIETLAIGYMMMSLQNIVTAYKQQHWLFVTLILLGLCDIGVAIQYIFVINIPWIWWFYLPSQVYFIKKAPSLMKIEPLQRKTYK